MAMTFDQVARYLVKDEPHEFLRWVFPRLEPRLRFTRWQDAQSTPRPGEPDRRSDTIAELVDSAGTSPPWLSVLELFTRPDPDALDRTIEYLGRFRREIRHGPYQRDRYCLMAAMIFLTGTPTELHLDMRVPGEDDVFFHFHPRPVMLAEKDAIATLTAIRDNRCGRTMLPWVPLMRGGGTPEAVATWKELVEAVPDRYRRLDFGAAALQFAELTKCEAVWRNALEGWNVEYSRISQEWEAKAEARGAEKGEAKGVRESVLRVVRIRFPGSLSPDLLAAVERQQNLNDLLHWMDVASTATDFTQVKTIVLGEATASGQS